MDGWFEVSNVALLDEHENASAKGEFKSVGRELLETIASNSQRRIDDTGDECPVVVDPDSRRGHTPRRGENRPMPKVVGYARNFRVVDNFGKVHPRAAIVCDMRFPEKNKETISEFPRRSVEIWPEDKIIDPISLCGAETPKRDLGLLTFSRNGKTKLRYDMDGMNSVLQNQELKIDVIVDAVMNAFAASPMGQWIAKQMSTPADEYEGEDDELEDEIGDEEESKDAEDEVPPKLDASDKEQSTNEDEDDSNLKEEPKKMTRTRADVENDDLKLKLTRMEDSIKVEREARLAAEKRFVRAERERALTQLQAQGYQFSRTEELDEAEGKTDEEFEKQLTRIKTRYQRAPVNAIQIGRYLGADGGVDTMNVPMEFTREDNEMAQEIIRREGVIYEVAREKVLAAKKSA